MTQIVHAAVVGVGRLGAFHALKYQALKEQGVELVALVDPEQEELKKKFPNTPIFANVAELLKAQENNEIPAVKLATVATPTDDHHRVATELLNHNVHLLIEKPLAKNQAQAKEIVDIAASKNLKIAVGHVERYRTQPLLSKMEGARFIECHRLAPFSFRSMDIDVILDLMIHDIDLMLAVVGSPLKAIHASGHAVLTDKSDIANARFEFENGCVANLTSSRISTEATRKFRVFAEKSYLSLDLAEGKFDHYYKNPKAQGLLDMIAHDKDKIEIEDALLNEVLDFVEAVRNDREPLVSGLAGLQALEVAESVQLKIKESQ